MLVQICAGLGLDRRAKEVFGGELQWFAIAIGFIDEKAETYMLDDRFDSIIFSLLFLNLLFISLNTHYLPQGIVYDLSNLYPFFTAAVC